MSKQSSDKHVKHASSSSHKTTVKKTATNSKKPKPKTRAKVKTTKTRAKSAVKKVNPATLKTKKRSKPKQTAAHVHNKTSTSKRPQAHKTEKNVDVMDEIFAKRENRSQVSKKTAAGVSAAKTKAKTAGQKSAYQRRSRKDTRRKKKAEYLATLPKSPGKRIAHRLSLIRALKYIFSKRGLKMMFKLAIIGFILLVVFIAVIFAIFKNDLDILDIERKGQAQTTVFYDRTGKTVLYELYGDENRKVIDFEDMSQYIKDATIAIEDKDFYNHSGFSVRGITRAFVNNVRGSDQIQGGSTITQQFIKNRLLTNERNITRKIKELILSIELERRYDKDVILELYLNEVAYGGQSYGIEAASQTYFGKSAADLTLDEAALLAALPQQPGNFNPYGGALADELPGRQKQVLQNLLDLTEQFDNRYTKEDIEKAMEVDTLAKLVPLDQQNALAEAKAPHFVLEVKKELDKKWGEQAVASGGLKVITTVDLELQGMAEQAVKDNIYLVDNAGGNNAALTSIDSKTGQVMAMVGSRDFNYEGFGSFNVATSPRQPGSSYKPYVFATLFKSADWGPGSVMYDVKTDFGGSPAYEPENFDKTFNGALTIRQSLGRSLNIPAVKAGYIAGIENVVQQAASMGAPIPEQEYYGLGVSLGAGEVKQVEHVGGYTSFANGGIKNDPVYILEVTNPKGEVLDKWEAKQGERVLDEQIAFLITDILSDRASAASQNFFVPGLDHAVKTGTTNDFKDGWMMGYTGCLTTGVWVGHNDNLPMYTASSSFLTGPIWKQFMGSAHGTLGDKDCSLQAQPQGIKSITLDRVTGKIPGTSTKNGTVTDLFPSWYKAAVEDDAKTSVYDTVSGFLATECTPEAARAEYTSGGISPEIPPTDPSYNRWFPPIANLAATLKVPIGGNSDTIKKDDVHKCDDKLPVASVEITPVNDNVYSISATATKGTHPLSSLNVSVNGETVRTYKVSSTSTKTFNYSFDGTGTKTVTVSVEDEVLYSDSISESVVVEDPTPTSPPISISATSDNSIISWSASPDADSYRVCVDGNNPPTTCYQPAGNATSHSPAGLTGTNYAYVEALDEDGNLITGSTSSIATLN